MAIEISEVMTTSTNAVSFSPACTAS